ncbi:MAG: hypothetical protein ACREQN_10750 [Candidatus Binataceae bacterium]
MSRYEDADAWMTLPDAHALARAGRSSDHPYNFGFVAAMSRLLAAHPRIAPPFFLLFGRIMFVPGALTRAEREMVAAVAAAAQDCHY